MQLQCPCCGEQFPIEAGFADADGKKLAALLAGLDPKLGRAVLNYLRLFSPAKRGLRMTRAIRLVEELLDLRADPTAADNLGRTPAHLAAEHRHVAVLRALCDHDEASTRRFINARNAAPLIADITMERERREEEEKERLVSTRRNLPLRQ